MGDVSARSAIENTAHHDAIGHHVAAVTPSPKTAQSHCTFEDQLAHRPQPPVRLDS
jgi:hypothetical protein